MSDKISIIESFI